MGFPNNQTNPAGAIPVWIAGTPGGTGFNPTDYTATIEAASPEINLVPANPNRRYLFIQAQTSVTVYFNFLGDATAPAPGEPGLYTIPAGGSYESGTVVPSGPISIGVSSDAIVTIIEG